ncbi:MAG: uroporphyrinogen decarboxylase family protein [Clostridiales bacterium]|jgi:uroporphyrinogen decarboxylase|nr:uroporphyrinogen-III decarboxylase [Eubacteriales bacterium]MDH7567686.1 uroporphyrinogen decarboxylase family protein [Clostridiales bacterium]
MKTGQELYNEHLNRIKTAVAMKKTDRTPVMLHAGAFCVRYAGGKLSDLVKNLEYGQELVLKGLQAMGDIDCVVGTAEYPPIMGASYLAHVKVPGRELPDDMQWQIDERGVMTEEDYDTVIDKGWDYFFTDVCKNRLDNVLDEMQYVGKFAAKAAKMYEDAGIVILPPVMTGLPFSAFCGGRTIPKFMRDLHRIPDKVQAAIDAAMVSRVESLRQQIRTVNPYSVFIGGGRGAGDFLSIKAFERFVWPYFKKLVEVMVEEGANAYLHLDLSWDRFLNYFLELPKGRCIFHPDSTTDIFKAKEVLQGHMCFMGDVSPSLLTLYTPDDVYEYSKRLVDEFSPIGFIMAAGCCVPANAKPENVKAMLAAAFDN